MEVRKEGRLMEGFGRIEWMVGETEKSGATEQQGEEWV